MLGSCLSRQDRISSGGTKKNRFVQYQYTRIGLTKHPHQRQVRIHRHIKPDVYFMPTALSP